MTENAIALNEEEKALLKKILEIGVYNGNHAEAKAYTPDGKEYKILCSLYNKVS